MPYKFYFFIDFFFKLCYDILVKIFLQEGVLMPFLFKRVRETLALFLVMGLIYSLIYKNIAFTVNPYAFPISCGGFLVLALFAFVYLLYLYLDNINDLSSYLFTNYAAYIIYMAVFYVLFSLAAFDIPFARSIYLFFFNPYNVFCYWGISAFISSFLVHIIYLAAIAVTPFAMDFIDYIISGPVDDYIMLEQLANAESEEQEEI